MREPEIFKEVIQRFYQKKDIDDEMLFWILDYMSELFVESHDDLEWQCYEWLLDKLNKVWQYKMLDQITTEQSYLYGGIWGCLSMLSYIKEKKSKSQKSHELAVQYEKDAKYVFLSSIYNNPGLQNRKLADICEVTPARISQIASEAIKDGLISVQEFGKEKCYFIRTLGECVYEIAHKQKDKLAENFKMLDYKMVAFSNDDNDFWIKVMRVNSTLGKLSQHNKVVVAVAFSKKQEDIQTKDIYELKEERKNNLWEQEMNSLYGGYMNSWNLQKEVGMINQL